MVEKVKDVSKAEILFGIEGFKKKEGYGVIVYYKIKDGTYFEDITFCKASKKIIFYRGSEFGSDAFVMNYLLLKAIVTQCKELKWKFNEGNIVVKNNGEREDNKECREM